MTTTATHSAISAEVRRSLYQLPPLEYLEANQPCAASVRSYRFGALMAIQGLSANSMEAHAPYSDDADACGSGFYYVTYRRPDLIA